MFEAIRRQLACVRLLNRSTNVEAASPNLGALLKRTPVVFDDQRELSSFSGHVYNDAA